MRKVVIGLKKKTKGYGVMEVILYLMIDSILLIMVASFTIVSFKYLVKMREYCSCDISLYEGLSSVDNLILVNNIDKIKKGESENNYFFYNTIEPDKGFELIYDDTSKKLNIRFNITKYKYNSIIYSHIKSMKMSLKKNVLYIELISDYNRRIEKVWTIK